MVLWIFLSLARRKELVGLTDGYRESEQSWLQLLLDCKQRGLTIDPKPAMTTAEIIRGIFLRGSGMGVLWPDAVALFGIGVLVLALASLRFPKNLD